MKPMVSSVTLHASVDMDANGLRKSYQRLTL